MRLNRILFLGCCVLLAVATCGCKSSPYELAPVSGIVTLDGEPVAGARVVFEPKRTGEEALNAGPGSHGKTDSEGHYQLQTLDDVPGAVVGLHGVTISTFQAEVDRTSDSLRQIRPEEIPERYRAPEALTFDVPSDGTDQAHFALESR